jgi:hypothetical protein
VTEPVHVAAALGEIVLVGLVLLAVAIWPLWRHLRKLERERDAIGRKVLEKWQPTERAKLMKGRQALGQGGRFRGEGAACTAVEFGTHGRKTDAD